jgi:hypothetical protein
MAAEHKHHHHLKKSHAEATLDGCYNQRFRYEGGYLVGWDGRVLDVEGGSKDVGARLCYYPKGAGLNQQFDLKDGYIIARHNGYVVDIWGGAAKDGCELRMAPAKAVRDPPNQLWDLDDLGFLKSRMPGNYVIDVIGGAAKAGIDYVALYPAKITPEQKHVVRSLANCYNQRWKIEGGFVYSWDGRVLDVEGGSKDVGAKVILCPKHGGVNQQFDHVAPGFLQSRLNGFVIDIWGGVAKNGGELRMGPKKPDNHDPPNQLWVHDDNGFIRAKCSPGHCIDVVGGVSRAAIDQVALYPPKM